MSGVSCLIKHSWQYSVGDGFRRCRKCDRHQVNDWMFSADWIVYDPKTQTSYNDVEWKQDERQPEAQPNP